MALDMANSAAGSATESALVSLSIVATDDTPSFSAKTSSSILKESFNFPLSGVNITS